MAVDTKRSRGMKMETAWDPTITMVECDASGTVYNHTMTAPLYGFDIKASGAYTINLAFAEDGIGLGQFIPIEDGESYGKEFLRREENLTVYLSADKIEDESAGIIVVEWSGT